MSGARYKVGIWHCKTLLDMIQIQCHLVCKVILSNFLQIKTMVLLMSYELLHVKTSCRKRREDLKQWMRPRIESSSTTTGDIA